ncbi:MAG: radical enzyme Cfr family protein [Sphingomonadales bacterium]|nr:radical enzyme Cfr family protein [Sphingomonadales bacterium]
MSEETKVGTNPLKVLQSTIDASVNFVSQQAIGYFESRYVRRTPEYFIAYLSSQSGCNRGCQFCHLTTTGQTLSIDANKWDFTQQADAVFKYYAQLGQPAKYVHYNFMARGEALANPHMLNEGPAILETLGSLAHHVYKLPAKFNVSTIMPVTLKKPLIDVFSYMNPTMYYSLYSVDGAFRKKWMPGAMDVDKALSMLHEYQKFNTKPVRIHFAMIEGENDSREDMEMITTAIKDHHLDVDFNIVRYNPGDDSSRETSEAAIFKNADYLRELNETSTVQVVTRVGLDVHASCGMFVDSEGV